jgi:hypothetical protein
MRRPGESTVLAPQSGRLLLTRAIVAVSLLSLIWQTSAQDIDTLFRQAATLENGAAHDSAGAAPLYAQAARAGHTPSMVRLGYLLQSGTGVAPDVPQALALYKRAADAGDPNGQFMLALANLQGVGGTKNPAAARELLRTPAGAGHQYAQYLLAGMLESGEGGEVREAAARRWFDKASAGPDANLAARAAAMRDKIDEHMLAPDNHAGVLLSALLLVAFAGMVMQGGDGIGGGPSSSGGGGGFGGGPSSSPPPCRPVPIPMFGNSMTANGGSLSNPGQQMMMGGC